MKGFRVRIHELTSIKYLASTLAIANCAIYLLALVYYNSTGVSSAFHNNFAKKGIQIQNDEGQQAASCKLTTRSLHIFCLGSL